MHSDFVFFCPNPPSYHVKGASISSSYLASLSPSYHLLSPGPAVAASILHKYLNRVSHELFFWNPYNILLPLNFSTFMIRGILKNLFFGFVVLPVKFFWLLSRSLPFSSLPSYWVGSCPKISHFHPCLLIGRALVQKYLIFILAFLLVGGCKHRYNFT